MGLHVHSTLCQCGRVGQGMAWHGMLREGLQCGVTGQDGELSVSM